MKNINADFLNPESGYSYEDLFDPMRLKDLAEDFDKFFKEKNKERFDDFSGYRDSSGLGFTNLEISNILIDSSYILNDFLVELFRLEKEQAKFIREIESEKKILEFKSVFQKKILKKFKDQDLQLFDWNELDSFADKVKQTAFSEYDFSLKNHEEKYTACFFLELIDIEKSYRWFYAGDKFAPENYTLPPEVKIKADKIISSLRSAGMIKTREEDDTQSDLDIFNFILIYQLLVKLGFVEILKKKGVLINLY